MTTLNWFIANYTLTHLLKMTVIKKGYFQLNEKIEGQCKIKKTTKADYNKEFKVKLKLHSKKYTTEIMQSGSRTSELLTQTHLKK